MNYLKIFFFQKPMKCENVDFLRIIEAIHVDFLKEFSFEGLSGLLAFDPIDVFFFFNFHLKDLWASDVNIIYGSFEGPSGLLTWISKGFSFERLSGLFMWIFLDNFHLKDSWGYCRRIFEGIFIWRTLRAIDVDFNLKDSWGYCSGFLKEFWRILKAINVFFEEFLVEGFFWRIPEVINMIF